MADEPRDLVLEHLRAMRTDIASMREDAQEAKARQAAVEDMFAFLVSAITRMQHSVDRLTERTQRIEKRLNLVDEHA
jgi:hypothetical protein